MQGKLRHACLALAVGSVLTVGCAHEEASPRFPSDPLLLSKRPVEGKPTESSPTSIASSEPAAPERLLAALPDNSIGPVVLPGDPPEGRVPVVPDPPGPHEVRLSPTNRRSSAAEE